MAWSIPEYPKKRVNWAGQILLRPITPHLEDEAGHAAFMDWLEALDIINNWRSSHNFPLNTFQNGLRKKGKQLDRNCLIAQRIKRLSSIELKLKRYPTMTLSQMQDIGGCRAILNNVGSVRKLCKLYEESEMKHKLHHAKDYINNPKDSGYRGVHLVYRYFSDKKEEYNTLMIEMQLRSQLQHLWATAVEVVGTFVEQALKSSIGEKEWLRFFALMGSAIAIRERGPLVPNTPTSYRELVQELRERARDLEIESKLDAFGAAVHVVETDPRDYHYYLIEVDNVQKRVNVTGFKQNQSEAATNRYLEAEKIVRSHPSADAVLVSVDSMAALQRAYPNYFLDTRLFMDLLNQTLRTMRVPKRRTLQAPQLPLL